ncbi:LysR substrate-binding domain-containing protein [Herminiimonas glaciei]|uniref:LysR substrate-binding domain-containing protein n=1 Tax=Herminiimonas glaciei TaxID=523788 RepID=A0ABW2I8I6_9BURK
MDQFLAVRAFTAVVETGSFVKAANALELPRNTVTKLVQALEAHLRVKLLNRTTRRVSTTNDGTAYYERMARLVDEWQEVDLAIGSAQSNPRGKLRVDMGATIATMLVIPALPEFQQRYPDLQIDIGVSDRPVDLLGDRVDCVVRGGIITDPSLIARQIGVMPLLTTASPAYLRKHGVPEHPSDLENDHLLIRYFFAGSGRKLPIELTQGNERIHVNGRHFLGINDTNAMLAAALAGLGIMHSPGFMVKPHIASGLLVPLLSDWKADSIPLSIVYAPNRHLSTRVRVFVDWMVELMRERGLGF